METARISRLLSLAKPEWRLLVVATFALLVGSAITLVVPQGIRILMDAVVQPDGKLVLDRTVIGLCALFAVNALFSFLRAYLFTLSGERVVMRLRKRLYGNLVKQEVGFFDGERTGELLNRLGADTGILQNSVTVNVSMALRFSLQALGSVCVLFWTSARLTGMMLMVVPLVAISAVLFARSVRKLSAKTQEALARANEVAEESFGNIRTVRSFSREAEEALRYGNKIDDAYDLGRNTARAYGWFQGAIGFFGSAAAALVLWYGGTLVVDGKLSVGTLTAFMLYTMFLGFSLASLSALFGDFNKALGASGRVFQLLDRVPGVVNAEGLVPEAVRGEMQLENVDFVYPTRPDAPVLGNVSITLAPGRVVALVGPSGSGKSTVAQLLARFYDPTSGRVLLDGRDVRELDTRWLREQIGSVAQEPVLFATSIADNIRYGRPDATMEQVKAAAEAANAHGFITQFPDGYETLVGERGVRLSGGQKQRVAIARAILKDPKILVLDEATSALDSESEHLVQQALERLMEGRSVLVIAHRLSTVKSADSVVVLERGRVVESGRHEELVAAQGVYHRLVERQFAT